MKKNKKKSNWEFIDYANIKVYKTEYKWYGRQDYHIKMALFLNNPTGEYKMFQKNYVDINGINTFEKWLNENY
jgi:hypothetical protein